MLYLDRLVPGGANPDPVLAADVVPAFGRVGAAVEEARFAMRGDEVVFA